MILEQLNSVERVCEYSVLPVEGLPPGTSQQEKGSSKAVGKAKHQQVGGVKSIEELRALTSLPCRHITLCRFIVISFVLYISSSGLPTGAVSFL